MNNPRLAGRYAKSLIDLAVEQNKLEEVYQDMNYLSAVCRGNKDFVAILKSPVIPSEKKEKILQSITTGNISKMTQLFIQLLMRKTRESNLPEIVNAFITQYNKLNNIHKVKVTTAFPISDQLREALFAKIRTNPEMQKIELEEVVQNDIIGGFKLEMGDLLVDATIARDLHDVRKQFMNNEYIHRLR